MPWNEQLICISEQLKSQYGALIIPCYNKKMERTSIIEFLAGSLLLFSCLLPLSAGAQQENVPLTAEQNNAVLSEPRAIRWVKVTQMYVRQGDDIRWVSTPVDKGLWQLVNASEITRTPGISWVKQTFNLLPENLEIQAPMAVYLYGEASAEVYLNGVFVGRKGVPGVNAVAEQAGNIEANFYVPPGLLKPENNLLAIRFSSHIPGLKNYRLALEPRIGPYLDPQRLRMNTYLPSIFLVSAIGIAAIFFGARYALRQNEKAGLWLALMFLFSVLQLSAELYHVFFNFAYKWQLTRLALVFVFAIGSGVFLNLAIMAHFGIRATLRWVPVALALILSLPLLQGASFNQATFFVSVTYVLLAISLAGYLVYQRQKNARWLLGGLIVLSTAFAAPVGRFLDGTYYYAMSLGALALFILSATKLETTRKRAAQVEALSNRLELELLKKHLQPHFIMNTLMALSEWIVESPATGVKMIQSLAVEFRILYEVSGKSLIPLAREIKLCHTHLDLMSYRKKQRFRLDVSIANEDVQIPPALFHTLIENALSHNRYQAAEIVFTLSQTEDSALTTYIFSAPVGKLVRGSKEANSSGGVGLSYIKARLEESWGDRATFTDRLASGPTPAENVWRSVIEISKGKS